MVVVVIAQALEECVVTNPLAEHVQDPRALLIIVWIEELHQILGLGIVNGSVALLFISEVLSGGVPHVITERFFAFILLDEQAREICSKAFAEPKIGPG